MKTKQEDESKISKRTIEELKLKVGDLKNNVKKTLMKLLKFWILSKNMNKNQQKKLLKSYIKYLWREIIRIVPIIRFYQIIYSNEYQNTDGGFVSIDYSPDLYEAHLIVYKSIWEEIPEKGLTLGFRRFIARALCHEAGHCYIWELEGRKSDKERKSTEIGILIFEILEMRRII